MTRLIEVSFPVDFISQSCSKEKSVRQGHISTLQQWWARRPLAICRAAIFSSLCPEPVSFEKDKGLKALLEKSGAPGQSISEKLATFVSMLSEWKNAENSELLHLANEIIMYRYRTAPSILDTFAGGGSFPVEALRLGLRSHSGELSPVAHIALKTAIEILPQLNVKALDEFRKVAKDISMSLRRVGASLYEDKHDKTLPLAFFWCRSCICPSCRIEIPLLHDFWLAKRPRNVAVKLHYNKKLNKLDFKLYSPKDENERIAASSGTVANSKATCPKCGHIIRLNELTKAKDFVQLGEILYAKCIKSGKTKKYLLTDDKDYRRASTCELSPTIGRKLANVPREPLDLNGIRHTWAIQYGVRFTDDLYNQRQKIALLELFDLVFKKMTSLSNEGDDIAVSVLLTLTFSRLIGYETRHTWWQPNGEFPANLFVRQALPMVWSYVEIPLTTPGAAGWDSAIAWIDKVATHLARLPLKGKTWQGDAAECPLQDKSIDLITIDPPYYDSVAYSYLSDVYYVWIKALMEPFFPSVFSARLSPKKDEAIVDRPHRIATSAKTREHFTRKMTEAMQEARRVIKGDGIMLVMYGHRKVVAWESILQAIFSAGFTLVASWPIHTERKTKFRHNNVDALSSSSLIVCRPCKRMPTKVIQESLFMKLLKETLRKQIIKYRDMHLFGADLFAALIAPACTLLSHCRVSRVDGTPLTYSDLLNVLPTVVDNVLFDMIIHDKSLVKFPKLTRVLKLLRAQNEHAQNADAFTSSWLTGQEKHRLISMAVQIAQLLHKNRVTQARELWEQIDRHEQRTLCNFLEGAALASGPKTTERAIAQATLGFISLDFRRRAGSGIV